MFERGADITVVDQLVDTKAKYICQKSKRNHYARFPRPRTSEAAKTTAQAKENDSRYNE
jgi:hypothetical protein